jgi:hypothetical protein
VNGISSLVDVPKGSIYDSAFFCNIVLPSLFDVIALYSRRKSLKGLYINLNNARSHDTRRSTECLHAKKIHRIPHLAYSSDLAPSTFFLFGDVKRKLPDCDISDRQSLKARSLTFSTKSDKKSSQLPSKRESTGSPGDVT